MNMNTNVQPATASKPTLFGTVRSALDRLLDIQTWDNGVAMFHEYARQLGYYPKVGLFVADEVCDEDSSPSLQPASIQSPDVHPRRRPSPSLMSRTLDARASNSETTASNYNRHSQREDRAKHSGPSSRSTSESSGSDTESETLSTSSDSSESEYDGETHPLGKHAIGSRKRALRNRRGAPYSKSQSRTQARIQSATPLSPITSSSVSTSRSPSPSHNMISENGIMYTIELDPRTNKQKYTCGECEKYSTASYGDLKRHFESLTHSSPSHFCVKECGQSFTRKDALIRHIKTRHKGVKIYYDEGAKRAFWRAGAGRRWG